MNDLVSLQEAAAVLKVSRQTIRRHVPAVRLGRRLLFRRTDLNNIINATSGPALQIEGGAAPVSEATNG
ncbi:helix-turn-helix domain-containing protein [Methylorubrum thiocyanatum]|uniref:helix-turn-helix domain-containing protein n=1 Tax=Methylorubrum thiocyanatum TaxID=47958 RepID=UPI0035C82C88